VGVGLAGVVGVVGASMAPTGAAGQTQVETPAYCQVLTTLGGGLMVDALTGTWPEPAAVTCHATGAGDIGEVWLTPVGSAAAASEAVATASRSWANPQWLEGFESGFGGGGENLPEGDLQRKNWVLYFARGTYVVHVVSGWVVDADPFGLELSSATAQSVLASARSLDAALQTPEVYGLPMAAGATTTTTIPDEAIVSPFGDGPLTRDELTQVFATAFGQPPRTAELRTYIETHFLSAVEAGRQLLDAAREAAGAGNPPQADLTVEQLAALDSLRVGLLLARLEPPAAAQFPALNAVQPVLIELAASAVGPPYDPDAALAMNRLIRMTVSLELSGPIPRDPPPTPTTGG
jgi:hypothetical protein